MHTIELGRVSVTRIPHFGNGPLPPAEFFPGTDPDLWQTNRTWLVPHHWDEDADRVQVKVRTWLLHSAGRTIVIDTGLAAGTVHPGGVPLTASLTAAGVTPADIDLVICTHLHADHVGGNTSLHDNGEWTPAFPHARYLFSRPDLDFFDPHTLTEEPGRSAAVYEQSIAPILRSGQAQIWDDSYTIDENLRLTLAPGHTPGHGVLTLESDGDRAVFAGDLLHSPVQVLAPEVSSCFCHDPVGAARTRASTLAWAADHKALVIPAHFGGAGAVEIERDGSRFAVRRWTGFPDT
ncbi:MBL fold metallo-hydrolase [Streptosporangium sp. NPDC051023]|uniref:MBL fold metallo-hydrolase n=1 Tax=Streptosporangium sp. NPDC051023 TaxID=3155410 RepID=UPI00344F4F3D